MRPLRSVRSVFFDCDSTLSAIEGIEHLAREHRSEIERLTEAAMRGEVPLEQVYGRRLEIVRPDRAAVRALARAYADAMVPDAPAVLAALRGEGVHVRIISGGVLPAVAAFGEMLGIERGAVAAVDLSFGERGEFAGWDRTSPLARSGGKAEVIRGWSSLPTPTMLVGDGATDLEARDVVDVFVGYGGVIARETVLASADAVIREKSLAPVLALALPAAPAAAAARELYEKGFELLDASTRQRLLTERGIEA